MTYIKQTWVENSTPVDATHMNHIEDGIGNLDTATGTYQLKSEKNQPSGYVGYDAGGNVTLLNAMSVPGYVAAGYGNGPGNLAFAANSNADTQTHFYIANNGVMAWGSGTAAVDVVLYRAGADVLKTDDSFYSATTILANASQANQIALWSDGRIYFNSAMDTNLYRYAANVLKTDGEMTSGMGTRAYFGSANTVFIGQMLGNYPGIIFGSAEDTYMYRAAASDLRTNGAFMAGGQIQSMGGGANRIVLGGDGSLYFGGAADTNLYRLSANSLRTGGDFSAIGTLYSGWTGSYWACQAINNGVFQTGSSMILANNDANGKLYFGSALDTNLYRSGVGQLKTDGNLFTGSQVWAMQGTADQVILGSNGAGQSPGIVFGSALDTNLYRSSAQYLRTNSNIGTSNGFVLEDNTANRWLGIKFGTAQDVSIFRSGPQYLKTDGSLDVAGNLLVENFLYLYPSGVQSQVTYGAPDSGGAGYRVLRVPN